MAVTYLEESAMKIEDNSTVELVFKIDKNPPVSFHSRNNTVDQNYDGITTHDREKLKLLLWQMRAATTRMLVGVQTTKAKHMSSFAFSVMGAHSSVNKFISTCDITRQF